MSPSTSNKNGLSLFDLFWRAGLVVAYRLLLVFWFITRPRSHGVYVLAWWNGQALFVRHSYKRGLYIPGGSPNRGEAYPVAAARELEEEVGIAVDPERLRRVGQLVNRHEYKYDWVEIFEVTLDREPEIRIDQREIIWSGFRSLDDLDHLDLSPMVREFLQGARREGPGPSLA